MDSDDSATRNSTIRSRGRRLFMQAMGTAGFGLAASLAVTGEENDGEANDEEYAVDESDDEEPTEIDSCTVIDEPGEYELVADLTPETLDQAACIVIDTDGVILRGNGHTIDVSDVEEDPDQRSRFGVGNRIGIAINPEPGANFEEDSWRTTVTDVVVRGGSTGIASWMSGRNEFSGVTAVENDLGFYFYVVHAVLDHCVVSDNNTGVRPDGSPDVFGGSDLSMNDSTVQANEERGINVVNSSSARIERSRIVGNGIGITTWEYSSSVLTDCHICGNEHYGVHNSLMLGDESHPSAQGYTRATDCYWGATNGPSSFGNPEEPYEDPETGRPADGDGDAISESLEPGVSNVRFDPFHEEPIDGVGADR